MTERKSNRGVIVDMESLIARQRTAVGNMNVNAQGDNRFQRRSYPKGRG